MKLADSANDDGVCWPSQRTLARDCGLSERSIRYKIEKLVADGLVRVEKRRSADGRKERNLYVLACGNGLPVEPAATQRRNQRQQTAGEPSREPSVSSSTTGWLPQSVGGRSVTDQEREWTDTLLDVFNAETGKRFAGKEWRAMVVRRLREHLDVGLDELVEMVKHQCAHPWWEGDPTPSVIFGNGRVFDMALNRVQGRGKKERERKFTRD